MEKKLNSSLPRLIKWVLLGAFLSTGLLLNFIIPPLQNPDEPQHFCSVLVFTYGSARQAQIESELLVFMNKNNWERYFGLAPARQLPKSFSETPYLPITDINATFSHMTLFHRMLGGILLPFKSWDMESLYRLSRFVSLLISSISLLLMASAFFKLSSSISPIFQLGCFFILLLPQFNILSLAVNPDVLSTMLGALYFRVIVAVFHGGFRISSGAALLGISILGLFIDKSCFFMAGTTACLPFFGITRRRRSFNIAVIAAMLLGMLLIMAWVTWFSPSQMANSLSLIKTGFFDKLPRLKQMFANLPFILNFLAWLIDSIFFKFGWMAFGAANSIYIVWRTMVILGFCGILLILFPSSRRTQRPDLIRRPRILKRLTGFLAAALLFQIMGLWIFQGTQGILPQGRYLFPTLFPLVFILLLGIHEIFSRIRSGAGRVALGFAVLALFFFFNTAIWNLLAPVFHLAVQSPFPGT